MKKRWLAVVILAVLATVLYVGASESRKEEEVKMTAMYLILGEDHFLFVDTKTDTPFYAPIPEELLDENGEEMEEEELENGDILEIYGNGIMLESYPGQYPGVTKMQRVGKGEEAQIQEYEKMLEPLNAETDETELPSLSITYRTEDAIVTSITTEGSYSFEVEQEDGTVVQEEGTSPPVLYITDLIECAIPEDTEIELMFSRTPESLQVTRYPLELREERMESQAESETGNPSGNDLETENSERKMSEELPEGEDVAVEVAEEDGEETITIGSKPGYVYRIQAEFENGSMEYGFMNTAEE